MNHNMTEAERAEYSKMYNAKHYVSTVDKIPKTAHYIVLQDHSFSYDAGYGDNSGNSTHTSMEYIYFDTEEALNYWILNEAKETYGRKSYKVLYVKPVEVKLHTTLEMAK